MQPGSYEAYVRSLETDSIGQCVGDVLRSGDVTTAAPHKSARKLCYFNFLACFLHEGLPKLWAGYIWLLLDFQPSGSINGGLASLSCGIYQRCSPI